jgi:uncharacterized protein (DUF2252 family)
LRTQPNPAFYEVLDVARRIAGTASLGIDRYVILIHGKGSPDRNYLLDLKQALPSVPREAARSLAGALRFASFRASLLRQTLQAVLPGRAVRSEQRRAST